MDIQILYVVLIALLTGAAIVVSFYVIVVLKEVRGTIRRANSLLEDVEDVTGAVKNPIVSILEIAGTVVKGLKTRKSIKSLIDDL
jgi:hypothetical protein